MPNNVTLCNTWRLTMEKQRLIDAIEDHVYATIYYNGFKGVSDADKALWSVLWDTREESL